jgi:ABC-type transport system involved in multi-copper enzyme maturation permease subunit
MQPTQPISLVEYLSPLRLVGPLADKELRVASRQRKYYLLRFAYVCLLTLVTMQFWHVVTQAGGGASAVVQMSRLSEAGKTIIVTIVWFQFVTGQILATVLLSDAISSEVRQRTLEGLLATPLGAVHIVLGKLLSKLLQVVLLLAISLPVLAVARVFGGVPWDYVVSGLCLTFLASVFAGALSLFYSIGYRQPYHAVLAVALWYAVVWGLLTLTMTSLAYLGPARATFVSSLLNPIAALVARTRAMVTPAGGPSALAPLWSSCLVLLFAAALVLVVSVRRVRRTALALGRPSLRGPTTHRLGRRSLWANPIRMSQTVRRVEGAPVVWKELCTPLFQARRQAVFHLALWVGVIGLLLIGVISFGRRTYGGVFLPIELLQGLFLICLAVTAAGAITREKEARTWSILLATPLENSEIVKGKAVAALRRNVALLLPLSVLYVLVPLLGPGFMSIVQSFLYLLSIYVSLAGATVFLLGLGLYLSTRLKTTAAAVVATLALYFVPKFLSSHLLVPWFVLKGPNVLPGVRGAMLAMAFAFPIVFAGIGVSCLRAAVRRLRRNVF